MKAPDFQYERPETLQDALAILAATPGEAQPLAGGQSLMPMMNFRIAMPAVLVDLSAISDLQGIAEVDGSIRIGAMTRYRDLDAWPSLAEKLPLVAMALPHIAHDAIRNRGTVGGSCALCDPAAEMPALMTALGAVIELAGLEGTRRVSAEEFFEGFYETACGEEELVTAIHVPAASGELFGFYELAPRHGDYATAGVAVVADAIAPIRGLRAVFFGISGGPVRLPALEDALEGRMIGDEAVMLVALEALADVDFLEDGKGSAAMRKHLAGVVLRRALKGMQT